MTSIEDVKKVLVETGRALETDKIKVIEIAGEKYSDYRIVTVTLTKKRCRKPYIVWNLSTDIVRELIFFDRSTFEYL